LIHKDDNNYLSLKMSGYNPLMIVVRQSLVSRHLYDIESRFRIFTIIKEQSL
jgi:hypothetical protein